jgi:hypothetical protein
MNMSDLVDDGIGLCGEESNETLNVSTIDRIEDIFNICSSTNSQIYSLTQLVNIMATSIALLKKEVKQW